MDIDVNSDIVIDRHRHENLFYLKAVQETIVNVKLVQFLAKYHR